MVLHRAEELPPNECVSNKIALNSDRGSVVPATGVETENEAASLVRRVVDLVGGRIFHRRAPGAQTHEERNYRVILQWLEGGSKAVFVTSFPRSGNTWMRYLLSDVFLQRAGIATTTALPIKPDRVIPDIYGDSLAAGERELTHDLYVKTHESFDRLKKKIPTVGMEGCRHVYIVRHPEDALVSFYHYHEREERLRVKVRKGKDAFCRERLREWQVITRSYVRAAEGGTQVYFVSYENLLARTERVLGGVLDWLGVEHEADMVRQAAANMKFDKMKTEEDKGRMQGAEFNGRGGPGAGEAELKAETLTRIREEARELLERVNGLIEKQEQAKTVV